MLWLILLLPVPFLMKLPYLIRCWREYKRYDLPDFPVRLSLVDDRDLIVSVRASSAAEAEMTAARMTDGRDWRVDACVH